MAFFVHAISSLGFPFASSVNFYSVNCACWLLIRPSYQEISLVQRTKTSGNPQPLSKWVKSVKKSVQKQEDKQTEENGGGGVELTHASFSPLSAIWSMSLALRLWQGLTGSLAPAVKQTEKRKEERYSIGFLYWLGQNRPWLSWIERDRNERDRGRERRER